MKNKKNPYQTFDIKPITAPLGKKNPEPGAKKTVINDNGCKKGKGA